MTTYKRALLIVPILLLASPLAAAQKGIIPRLENGENLKIAAIGTSLTATPGSWWFGDIGTWLSDKYPGQVTLYDEAVSGSASKYTATYTLPESGLDVQLGRALAHAPDAIFIEFAINDAYTPYSITQPMSKDNLQTMINQVNAYATGVGKTVNIVVQTMNNCADVNGHDAATKRPDLASYYQGYRDVAAANSNVLLIDNYPNWVDLYNSEPNHATWLSYMDSYGIHPNAAGTQAITMPEIKRALLSQTPEPSSAMLLLTVGSVSAAMMGIRRRIRHKHVKEIRGNTDTIKP